jgi:enoyl-CoA hydratase/carnithine racemase
MAYETLLTELRDGVMTVTLNRPDKLNAFNPAMSRELIGFFRDVNAMDEVRAVVVTGAGRAFCAGADISSGSGFVFNKRGMAIEAGSCWFLPRLVGMQQAQEWVMMAELFGAEEALSGGLVRSVHAPEELLPAAQALAGKFAASTSSSVAMAVNRRLMWSMWGAQDPLDAVTLDLQCVGHLAAGAGAQEGIKSFFEKRAPVFPLRPSKDMPPFGPWGR